MDSKSNLLSKIQNIQKSLVNEKIVTSLFNERIKNSYETLSKCINDYNTKIINKLQIIGAYELKNLKSSAKFEDNPEENFSEGEFDLVKSILFYIKQHPSVLNNINSFLLVNDKDLESLAFFFNNFLYDYTISKSDYDNGYLSFVYSMLEAEIKEIISIEDTKQFLEKTFASYIFKNLLHRKEINDYFKKLFTDIFNLFLPTNFPKYFNINEIKDDIRKNKNKYKEKDIEAKTKKEVIGNQKMQQSNIKKDERLIVLNSNFGKKYLMHIKESNLIEYMDDIDNQIVKDYIQRQIDLYKKSKTEFPFGHHYLLNDINKEVDIAILVYQETVKSFWIVVDMFEKLMNSLFKVEIPFILRCISKMICVLLKSKFPSINKIDINKFIGKFFIEILFESILENKIIFSSLSSHNIPENIHRILSIVIKIIKQFSKGNLFLTEEEQYLTIFNSFILDHIQQLFNFFDQLTNIHLNFKVIKGDDKENAFAKRETLFKDSISQIEIQDNRFFKNVTLSYSDLFTIFQGIKKKFNIDPNSMEKEDKTFIENFNKLKNNKKFMYTLLRLTKKEREEHCKIYITVEETYLEALEKMSTIKPYDNPKEENSIIIAKKLLICILGDFREITYEDMSTLKEESLDNIVAFCGEVNNYKQQGLKKQLGLTKNATKLRELLKTLPNEYKENNYAKLLNEIQSEIPNELSIYDVELLTHLKKEEENFIAALIEKQIENVQLKEVIQNVYISEIFNKLNFTIIIKLNSIDNSISIEESLSKQSWISHEKDILLECSNCNEFIENFKIIAHKITIDQKNFYSCLINSKLPEKLNEGISLIKSAVQSLNSFNLYSTQSKDLILSKINNLILMLLFDDIFPSIPQKDDKLFHRNCVCFSWIKEENLFATDDLYIVDFTNEIIDMFISSEKEKNPSMLLELYNSIFQKCTEISEFNKNNISFDNILLWVAIKAKPTKVFSRIKYIKVFNPETTYKCDLFLYNFNYLNQRFKTLVNTDLIGVDLKDFQKYLYIYLFYYSNSLLKLKTI